MKLVELESKVYDFNWRYSSGKNTDGFITVMTIK